MIPTYVFGWPTGKETGNYLAVDLGEFCCLRFTPSHVIREGCPQRAHIEPCRDGGRPFPPVFHS